MIQHKDFILVHPNLGLHLVLTQIDEISTNTTNNAIDFYNFQPLAGLHNISLTIAPHMSWLGDNLSQPQHHERDSPSILHLFK